MWAGRPSTASRTGAPPGCATTAWWPWAKSPADALHVTAMVELAAEIVLGACALGGAVHLPDKVNGDFAGVYQYLRTN